jgi:transcriptional regulator with XRE-family HTH domain
VNALANTLQTVAASPSALTGLAAQADVPPRQVAMARAGKPINAGAYLALCGAAGVDPVDGSPRPTKAVSCHVEWWLLGTALRITRGLRRLNQRNAARAIGVSPSTVCRVEKSSQVSIANMVKVCAFIGVHPDGYTVPVGCARSIVSRETPTETRCSDSKIRHEAARA